MSLDCRHPIAMAELTKLARYDTGTIGGIQAMKYWRRLFSTGYVNPKDNYPDVTASQSSEIVYVLVALLLTAFFLSPQRAAGYVSRVNPLIDGVLCP